MQGPVRDFLSQKASEPRGPRPPSRIAGPAPAPYVPAMIAFETILDDFAFLDDWDDRYKYLIDLGRRLEPYPEDKRDEEHKVRGCASQVWLDAEIEDGKLSLRGDSDAHIVRGLVAVMIALYAGRSPEDVTAVDVAEALRPLDLQDHLTPQRSNGLAAMDRTIREIAAASR